LFIRVRVDLFKGMTHEQRNHILQVQEQQRKEAEASREKERQREMQWAIQEAANTRVLTLLEREKERRKKEFAVQIRRENEHKAVVDKDR
jgi:hypothetical protein